jgi:putative ATP-binding cassette transporter
MNTLKNPNRNPIVWIKDCITLAKPFWQSEKRYLGYLLVSLVIILQLATVVMNVLINKWNNSFYDAIQRYDIGAFYHGIITFSIYATIYIACAILAYLLQRKLEIIWRQWLTTYYLDLWLSHKAFYKSRFLNQVNDNPDQRISDDVNSFIILSLELSLGFVTSLVNLFSFISILWGLSGIIHFTLFNHPFNLHGYMVWVAIMYSFIATYIKFKVGKPLVRLDYQEQAYEAHLRYNLVRVKENSESIAFYNGETQEKHNLTKRIQAIVDNFGKIIYRQLKLNIIEIGYQQIAMIFPLVAVAPRYFTKLIKLGDVMQITNAFSQVHGSLSYFMYSYTTLAGLRATMDRLFEFLHAVDQAKALPGLPIKSGIYPLEVNNLSITTPSGQTLTKNICFLLKSGDKLLVKGKTGCGKTTLLRSLAGMWHFASGEIKQAPNLVTLFISQKPYLPIDSLLAVVSYPSISLTANLDKVTYILNKCELGYLLPRLNDVADWSTILSLGEQQKIAFARILLNQPDIVYCDEATSALDEESESNLYQLICQELPNITIVSVAHRSSVATWHNKFLNLSTLDIA